MEKIVDVALELAAHAGRRPEKRTIVETVAARRLCSRRTVERRWAEVDAGLTDWECRQKAGQRPGDDADPDAGHQFPVPAA